MPSRSISPTAWSRRSLPHCRAFDGYSSSLAIEFTYKGQAVDIKRVGRELGVRYVLEGSVRKGRNQVRITGQLIDAGNGAHLWADRFDGPLEDIFELQDQVTASVVGAIAPRVEQAEIYRAKHKPTDNLDAYDNYLRGVAGLHAVFDGAKEAVSEALQRFYRAIDLDPEFASAFGMAAWCYVLSKNYGWSSDDTKETAELERLARQAARLAKEDAVALYTGGFAPTRVPGQLGAATALIDRALALDPNLAAAWHLNGWVKLYRGEPEAAMSTWRRRCASTRSTRCSMACKMEPPPRISSPADTTPLPPGPKRR